MKIKILVSCSGRSFSYTEGDTVDAEKRVAEDLVRCGFAEKVQTAKTTVKKTASGGTTAESGDGNADT